MYKIKELLHSNKFQDKDILLLILQNILKLSKEEIYLNWDIKLSKEDYDKLRYFYNKYENDKIPIEYILKYSEFMGEKFYINENVLIPRPETEYLVNYVYKDFKSMNNCVFIDVGTGSGIIAIILSKLTGKKVLALDISEEALKVAKKNSEKILNSKDILFIKSNLLESLPKLNENKLVFCANLPYVENDFILDDYTKKEPSLALFSGLDGLDLYRRLLDQIFSIKGKEICAYFELTNKQAKILNEEFNLNGEILTTCHDNIKIFKIKTPQDKPRENI